MRVMGDSLVQVLQEFTHAGDGNAEGLHEQEELLRLKILQG